ncbi:MAG: hypothetical protein WD267_13770 [Balneolales bacterium]
MGQQQLLLVILVTIIVGIATVVAINVFGSSAASANRDSVRQDMLSIGAAAQGWYIKPSMMGGGGNSFEGMSFNDISFPAEKISSIGLSAENMNGTYVISGGSATEIVITGHPASDESYIKSAVDGDAGTFTAATESMEATIVKDGMGEWTVGGEAEPEPE